MATRQAKVDRLIEGTLFRAIAESRQGATSGRAVLPCALQRCCQGTMVDHQLDRVIEVAVLLLEILERPAPEAALRLACMPQREHDREGDLSFSEIVAHGLPEFSLL